MEETTAGQGTTNVAEDAIGGDINETFDNMEYESEASKKLGEKFNTKFKDRIERAKNAKKELEQGDKPEKKAEKKDKPKKEDDEDLDGKKPSDLDVFDKETEKPKDEKKTKESKKDDETADDPEKSEKDEDTKADAKKLKIRMSDGLYGIEADSKVRVKIDGAFQEVPMQELINNYSGKQAWDKKFTEIGHEKKAIESERGELTKKEAFMKETLSEVLGHINDPEKNPFDALFFLVEKSGQDTYSVYKRAMEANLDEIEKIMAMSDVERQNHWLTKKDEFRTKSEEARKAAFTKEQSFNQAVQKVDSLRQAHGVSEEQYLQALDELESEGHETAKMSDEQVVDHASLKPHVSDVQDVLEPYEDSLDDSKYSEIVRSLARQLRAKDFTKEQLTEWARKEFMDPDVKDLQARTKIEPKKTSKVDVKAPTKLETLDFDDED